MENLALSRCPETDVDPFSIEYLSSPHRYQAELMALGPVAYVSKYGFYVLSRYTTVYAALRDPETFCSSRGVGLTDFEKEPAWRPKSIINEADPPEHSRPRAIMTRVLARPVLEKLRTDFREVAVKIVDAALERAELDGIEHFAQAYPLRIIPDAVGMMPEGRENLLPYGDMVFNAMGPRNELFEQAMKKSEPVVQWVVKQCRRESLSPTGIGARIYDEVAAGNATEDEAGMLVRSVLSAGMDTTVFGLGHMLYYFGNNPEQWEALREDPSLIRSAWNEIIRMGSTVQALFRTTTKNATINGITIPEGTKVMLLLAAANRDPHKFPNPDRFDISRKTAGHVGFGFGTHMCVGQTLSTLEAEVLLEEMIKRIATIEIIGDPVWRLNNMLRGLRSLPVRFVPA
jgi:cytochrome P450